MSNGDNNPNTDSRQMITLVVRSFWTNTEIPFKCKSDCSMGYVKTLTSHAFGLKLHNFRLFCYSKCVWPRDSDTLQGLNLEDDCIFLISIAAQCVGDIPKGVRSVLPRCESLMNPIDNHMKVEIESLDVINCISLRYMDNPEKIIPGVFNSFKTDHGTVMGVFQPSVRLDCAVRIEVMIGSPTFPFTYRFITRGVLNRRLYLNQTGSKKRVIIEFPDEGIEPLKAAVCKRMGLVDNSTFTLYLDSGLTTPVETNEDVECLREDDNLYFSREVIVTGIHFHGKTSTLKYGTMNSSCLCFTLRCTPKFISFIHRITYNDMELEELKDMRLQAMGIPSSTTESLQLNSPLTPSLANNLHPNYILTKIIYPIVDVSIPSVATICIFLKNNSSLNFNLPLYPLNKMPSNNNTSSSSSSSSDGVGGKGGGSKKNDTSGDFDNDIDNLDLTSYLLSLSSYSTTSSCNACNSQTKYPYTLECNHILCESCFSDYVCIICKK